MHKFHTWSQNGHILYNMNSFKVFDGNEGEYDTRLDVQPESQEWTVGVNLLLTNFDDDVKIFTPRFSFLNRA